MTLRRESLLIGWVALLVAGALAMCVGLVVAGYTVDHPLIILALAGLAVAAERQGISLTPAIEVSVASALSIIAAVGCGPLSAVVVGGSALLADLPRRDGPRPILRWVTWT